MICDPLAREIILKLPQNCKNIQVFFFKFLVIRQLFEDRIGFIMDKNFNRFGISMLQPFQLYIYIYLSFYQLQFQALPRLLFVITKIFLFGQNIL